MIWTVRTLMDLHGTVRKESFEDVGAAHIAYRHALRVEKLNAQVSPPLSTGLRCARATQVPSECLPVVAEVNDLPMCAIHLYESGRALCRLWELKAEADNNGRAA